MSPKVNRWSPIDPIPQASGPNETEESLAVPSFEPMTKTDSQSHKDQRELRYYIEKLQGRI